MDLSNRGETGNLPILIKSNSDDDQLPQGHDVVTCHEENVNENEGKKNSVVVKGLLLSEEKDVSEGTVNVNEENPKSVVENNSNCDDHGDNNAIINDKVNDDVVVSDSPNDFASTTLAMVLPPYSQLPKPEAPRGLQDLGRSRSMPESYDFDVPAIGKFIREKSHSLSAAITKRISLLKETGDGEEGKKPLESHVTEINLSGLKVIVNFKPQTESEKKLMGRVSFFSRSNCRDCSAVRSFLRDRNLNYVEINIDVYPMREKELIQRTGNASVPQIFFNEKLFGGLVALNSSRNSGMLDKKLEEMLAGKCPTGAPAPPVYGFDDDPLEESTDDMVQIVRILRQRLPIQDRLMKMKIVRNCFSGGELVEILIHHLDCGRRKAVDIGKQLARKHFIHHVFGENEFEDGNNFYRFLEHEPFIPKCYNFRGLTNDSEPKSAVMLSQKLTRIMTAILEAYASDDRRSLDYLAISNSEEFRRYLNIVHDLQRVNIMTLSEEEKLAFFLNLYNAMAIHAVIKIGHPGGMIDRRAFFSDFLYVVGGYPFSLAAIRNGILRSNRRAPFSLVKPFSSGDKRLELALPKINQMIHFGICNGTRSSPAVKFFTAKGVDSELRYAAREFFQRDDAMLVDLAKRTVHLSRIIKWYSADFGQEKEILKWILSYLDATKAGLLTHLLGDGGPVNIVYQSFDWSLNSGVSHWVQ